MTLMVRIMIFYHPKYLSHQSFLFCYIEFLNFLSPHSTDSPFHHHNLALAAAAAVAAQQRHLQQQQQQHKQSQQKNSVDHHHQNLMDQDANNMHMYFETKSESGSEILSRPPTPNSTSYSINDMINQQIESIPINNIANISGGGGSQNDSNNRG